MAASVEQWAVLLAKVLSGAKPGDLPIERPSKFDVVVNLKIDFHLTVPDTFLLTANRVIGKYPLENPFWTHTGGQPRLVSVNDALWAISAGFARRIEPK